MVKAVPCIEINSCNLLCTHPFDMLDIAIVRQPSIAAKVYKNILRLASSMRNNNMNGFL